LCRYIDRLLRAGVRIQAGKQWGQGMSVAHAQVGVMRIEGIGLSAWVEASLLAGIVLSVIAFGGTEPASFALVEILFAGVAIVVLAKRYDRNFVLSTGMLVAPALLMGAVLLQLCPLPVGWIEDIGAGQSWG